MSRKSALTAMCGLGLCWAAQAKEVDLSRLPPPADLKNVTFEKQIRPIFEKSCVKCHSGEKPKGKLRLDSLAGVLKGSEDGTVIKPGNSAKSVLLINVAQLGDSEDWMPPPDNKADIPPLTREQVSLIRAWIEQGAK